MAKQQRTLTNFTGGQWSRLLDGRYDLEKYAASCRTLENFIIRPEGGVFRRPGTYFTAETKDSASVSRLIAFIYDDTDSYTLEFGYASGAGYIRFYRGWEQVESAPSTPYEIISPYAAADLALLKFDQNADVMYITHPDYPPQTLSRIDNDDWTIEDTEFLSGPFLAENDTEITITVLQYAISAVSTGVGGTFTLAGVGDLSDVYEDGVVFTIHDSTNNDGEWTVASTVFTPAVGPFVITVVEDVQATADGHAEPNLKADGVVQLEMSGIGQFAAGHVGSLWQLTLLSVDESISESLTAAGQSSASVGLVLGQTAEYVTSDVWSGTLDLERSYTNGDSWATIFRTTNAGAGGAITGSYLEENDASLLRWTFVTDAGQNPTVTITTDATFVNGVVRISEVTSSSLALAVVTSELAHSDDPTTKWSEGSWSGVRGYPTAIALYEQRAYYAGTEYQPNTAWASVAFPGGDYTNFLAGTEDDDAFAFTIAEAGQGPIKWLAGDRSLIAGTVDGPYSLSTRREAGPLSPNNPPKASVQNVTGVCDTPAVNTSLGLLYVERGDKRLSEFVYSWEQDRFITANMMRLASDITGTGIKEIAYQTRPEHILWCVLDDGNLIGLTYDRAENIVAWHKHTTLGSFESIAIKPGKASTGNADEDELWFIVKRTIEAATVRYVERMMPWDWGTDQDDAFFVDAGATYDGASTKLPGGWSHLVGETLSPLADGGLQNTPEVAVDGSIALDSAASVVQGGLPYTSTLIPSRPPQGQFGLGSRIRRVQLVFTFFETMYAKYGPDTDNLDEIPFRDSSDNMDTPVPLFSGQKKMDFQGGFDVGGDLLVVCDKPLPCNVSSIVTILEIE